METSEVDWEVASVILIHKVKTLGVDKFSDLGFMTLKDIKKYLLHQFNVPEVETAVLYTVHQGELDLYYEVKCANCAHTEHIKEIKPEDNLVAEKIVNGKIRCEECAGVLQVDGGQPSLKKRYAIPLSTLGGFNQGVSDLTRDESTFNRIIRWMLPCLKKEE